MISNLFNVIKILQLLINNRLIFDVIINIVIIIAIIIMIIYFLIIIIFHILRIFSSLSFNIFRRLLIIIYIRN